jgi:hypothetical protein
MKRRAFFKSTFAALAFTVSGAAFAVRAAAADFCGKGWPRRKVIILPPPPKWDRATDGLESAYKWAADYERSLLRPGIVFPREGQIWEALCDCEVRFGAWIPRTILPSGMARLQRGERVRILTLDGPRPIQIQFQPVRYHELHASIVPVEIRSQPGYQYYVLSLRLARTLCSLRDEPGFFHELFQLVEDVA